MMFEIPNIRHLRVFHEVVISKSISGSSSKVFLSQPAITQAISKLELLLNTSLFHRRNNGMYPTESGEIFFLRVNRALDYILIALKEVLRVGNSINKSTRPAQLLALLSTTQLRALIAVTEAKNFSIAGRNIGVSQPSIHRAARDIEDLLKIELFEKTSTGISPSRAAKLLTKATKLAFSEIRQGREEIYSHNNSDIGRIAIGSMPLIHASILPKAIVEFSSLFPKYNISINDGTYDDLLYHLRHGDIDLLIGALRLPIPADDVEQEILFSSTLAIVSRLGHPLQQKKQISAEMLFSYPWIVPRKGTPTRTSFDSIFSSKQLEIPINIVESSSQILIREVLIASDRLSIYSEHQIQNELNNNILTTIPYLLKETNRPIGVTFRKNWKPTKRQSLFIDILRKNSKSLSKNNK